MPTTGEDYRIGGTEAPTVRILLKGDRSFVQEVYDYGYIPAMSRQQKLIQVAEQIIAMSELLG
ncbi:hypothetical protein ALO94_201163 [Pseudomonas syringae pv. spinaceae]|uniref:levansucrase n=1 Tax=Pseudomonas syringae pv. spinaceae TaxID=264459 RepID=A0A0Q0EWZ5_PSESX|nr:hypothetical protein ALO94_201163 [Pseudomonas syringae pv. spinaceae]